MHSQLGATWMGYYELTFTGSTYTLGTFNNIETYTYQGMTTPPLSPTVYDRTGVPTRINGTNYGFFGFEYLTNGAFRVSKNGDATPFIDVLNSLFCAAEIPQLHPNLGSHMVTMNRTTPMKGQLLDYTITGPIQASVSLPTYFGTIVVVPGISTALSTPDIPAGNFAFIGIGTLMI